MGRLESRCKHGLANSCKKLTAARFPLPGLKPLFPAETNGVMPLADLSRRLVVSRGNRHAAWAARTRGLAAAYATNVRRTQMTLSDLARAMDRRTSCGY